MEKLELRLNSGYVTVPIIDDDSGELVGKFRFNPADFDIIRRYDDVVEALEGIKFEPDTAVEDLAAASEKMKEQLDYLLGCKVSEDIFAICNPFTIVSDGDLFVEKVLAGIASIIEQTMKERVETKKAKISKATAKYHNT